MFGLGFSEIVIIAILALLVFGPEKVPELLGTLGKWMRYARGATNELRRTIETEGRKIVPPDLKLPRFDDLLKPSSSPPPAAPPPAPDGPINYGYGEVPRRRAGATAAAAGAAAEAAGDPSAAVLGRFDEELDAPDRAVAAKADRRPRVDAIARALEAPPAPPSAPVPPGAAGVPSTKDEPA